MPALTIRAAEGKDVDAVTRLINQAFVAESPYVIGERIHVEGVRELLTTGTFLIGELEGALVAGVYIEQRGDRAHIGLVSVDPARQRSGFGAQIMHAAEARCRAAGSREMELRFINHRHELQTFYARLGYAITGVTESPDPKRMKVQFRFVQMVKPLS